MVTQYYVQTFDEIASKIAEHGICIMDHFISEEIVTHLSLDIQNLAREASLHQAGTGAGNPTVNQTLRGDFIAWLDDGKADLPESVVVKTTVAQKLYFEKMELLRLLLNRHLYLGLFGLESHLALYPAGAFYKKHLDRFKNKPIKNNQAVRQISCILYLNADWQDSNGGQLRVYTGDKNNGFFDVIPRGGRLVTFLSDTFYHEVLPASQDRLSIAGWFLSRAS